MGEFVNVGSAQYSAESSQANIVRFSLRECRRSFPILQNGHRSELYNENELNFGRRAPALPLLKACVRFECDNFVFSSSCATYGVPKRLPIAENDPQEPVNPYGHTKLAVERMLRDAEVAHGIRSVTLRYFNAAGADPAGELGELHEPETHLIPLVLFAAMGRLPAIEIFGNDYPTVDGTCVRDYVHFSDLAAAHTAAVDWLAAGKPSNSFNLGNGRGHYVAEVIRTVESVTGLIIKVEIRPRRGGDPPNLVRDSTRARELLGWSPKYSRTLAANRSRVSMVPTRLAKTQRRKRRSECKSVVRIVMVPKDNFGIEQPSGPGLNRNNAASFPLNF